MNRQQLELTLGNARRQHSAVRRQRRLSRARWWFDQMHMAVDQAMDLRSGQSPQNAQEQFTLARHG